MLERKEQQQTSEELALKDWEGPPSAPGVQKKGPLLRVGQAVFLCRWYFPFPEILSLHLNDFLGKRIHMRVAQKFPGKIRLIGKLGGSGHLMQQSRHHLGHPTLHPMELLDLSPSFAPSSVSC